MSVPISHYRHEAFRRWLFFRDRLAMWLSRLAQRIAPVWAWDVCPECGQERDPDVPGCPWGACRTSGCSLEHWAQPPNIIMRKGRSPGTFVDKRGAA